MMYGEMRRGISEHTLVCSNTTSSSSERKRIRWICAARQRLAAGASGLTKAIVPEGIIARPKEMRKIGTVNFLFTAFLLCDKIEKKEEA